MMCTQLKACGTLIKVLLRGYERMFNSESVRQLQNMNQKLTNQSYKLALQHHISIHLKMEKLISK